MIIHRDSTYVLATGQGGQGQSVSQCMQGLGVKSGDQLERVRQLEETQRLCLYNVLPEDGYSDLYLAQPGQLQAGEGGLRQCEEPKCPVADRRSVRALSRGEAGAAASASPSQMPL